MHIRTAVQQQAHRLSARALRRRVQRGPARLVGHVDVADHAEVEGARHLCQIGRPRSVVQGARLRQSGRRPPEPEDKAVGRSTYERSGRRVVGHLHLIDGEQQVAGLQQATGQGEASHSLEDGRRARVAAVDEIEADRRAARRLGQLDDHSGWQHLAVVHGRERRAPHFARELPDRGVRDANRFLMALRESEPWRSLG